MKKGTPVSWQLPKGLGPIGGKPPRGSGVTIADEVDGHVLVAVDTLAGEPNPGFHQVIWCAVTWLTDETPVQTA